MLRSRLILPGLVVLLGGSVGCGAGSDGNDEPVNGAWNPATVDGSTSAVGDGGSGPSANPGGGTASGGTAGTGGTGGTSAGDSSTGPGGSQSGRDGGASTGGSGSAEAGTDGGSRSEGGVGPEAGALSPDTGVVSGPACSSKAPAQFELNTKIGGGSGTHKDSAHFALFGSSNPDPILNFMEAAHKCFIEDWCFRSPGLPVKSTDAGPYYKTNFYSDGALGAGGLTYWDASATLSYVKVLSAQSGDPRTTVHEYGHAITMSEYNWIDQKRTGFWWETVANWVSYSFLTSPYCEGARNQFGVKPATTIIDQMHTLTSVYNQSYAVICNDQNYYQAWPFLTYLTNNPDNYPGLGKMAVQDLMRKYAKNSNETPIHTLERIAAPVKAQTILGRYWARMAYFDIGMPVGQKDFLASRGTLTFAANLDGSGSTYTVKSARKPQYGGANITPLKLSGSGEVGVTVTNLGNGLTESNFTATLSIRASSGAVRYVDLPGGTGKATIAAGEEFSLVVVNTPSTLYLFDPQTIRSPENVGLNYRVELTGATP